MANCDSNRDSKKEWASKVRNGGQNECEIKKLKVELVAKKTKKAELSWNPLIKSNINESPITITSGVMVKSNGIGGKSLPNQSEVCQSMVINLIHH